jgi:SAM-dependent methyltransferase
MNLYLSGDRLYGEDLSQIEIEQWFSDEKEGYRELTPVYRGYAYHALNIEHCFRYLPDCTFQNVLGVGSAYGYEFDPIIDRCKDITLLEPSDGFDNPRFRYVKPCPSGDFPFPDQCFDLITCFSVLHHIPKVSVAVKEMSRVLAPHGVALISEPIISMGDWSHPRKGLTKHERGIPLRIFRKIIADAGLEIKQENFHSFALSSRWKYLLKDHAYNSRWVVQLDKWLCKLPWFADYHATGIKKLRATGVSFVLTKSPHN